MPIFEEKLICPLAVRFTQGQIRPTFQDKHDIEATIKAIKMRPGVGPYDVILEAPFPVVEIMRWHPREKGMEKDDAYHWFTLDNRRLYCLQRAAIALWPQRVAALVEALYAAPEGALRKSDSSTAGRSVAIGHTAKDILGEWDWRKAMSPKPDAEAYAAQQFVTDDDRRAKVEDLLDAPAPPSMLELYMRAPLGAPLGALGALAAAPPVVDVASTSSSTRGPSESSPRSADDAVVALTDVLSGTWVNEKYETFEVKARTDCTWTCTRTDAGAQKNKLIFWYDEKSDTVSWGDTWSLYMDASALKWQQDEVKWFGGNDTAMRAAPRTTWWKATKIARAPQRLCRGRAGNGVKC